MGGRERERVRECAGESVGEGGRRGVAGLRRKARCSGAAEPEPEDSSRRASCAVHAAWSSRRAVVGVMCGTEPV
jgi:hypothetical protein